MSADTVKVEVVQLSVQEMQSRLEETVRKVLEESGGSAGDSPIGALKASEAAAYIGLGRTKFYELIQTEPLLQRSFYVGATHLWRIADLDDWLAEQVERAQKNRNAA